MDGKTYGVDHDDHINDDEDTLTQTRYDQTQSIVDSLTLFFVRLIGFFHSLIRVRFFSKKQTHT